MTTREPTRIARITANCTRVESAVAAAVAACVRSASRLHSGTHGDWNRLNAITMFKNAAKPANQGNKTNQGATLGFEATFWATADKLRGMAKGDVSIFGQERNPTTWRLARMYLAIRSIEVNLGQEPPDIFHRDLHKDLKADYPRQSALQQQRLGRPAARKRALKTM
jgi:hypothetical protein